MSDTSVYKWEDVNGGVHYGLPMEGDPPEKIIKNPTVKKMPMGGNNTQGYIYYQAEKTEEDKASEAEVVKNKKAALESQQAISKSIREAKEAKEAADKAAADAAEVERMQIKHMIGVSGGIECKIDLPGGIGGNEKFGPMGSIGRNETKGEGDIVLGKKVKIRENLPDSIVKKIPIECEVGATITANPKDVLEKIGIKKEKAKEVGDISKEVEKAIDKTKDGIKAVKDKADEVVTDEIKKHLPLDK